MSVYLLDLNVLLALSDPMYLPYLLGLAAAHRGKLATFDRRIVASAVRGGAAALEIIEA